jgi:hypothetical protein
MKSAGSWANFSCAWSASFCFSDRAVARVLHAQPRGEDEHVVQAALVAPGEDHPPDPRVDGQAGEVAADVGELALVVDRAELAERVVAVADELRESGGSTKGNRSGRPSLSAPICSTTLARLVRWISGGVNSSRLLEVVLAVEAVADAGPDAPAPALALVRRRLADRLDVEALDLGARAVAADARGAGVDDVADARHGQRGLGDVGRDHDPPPGWGLNARRCSSTERRA